MTQDQIVQELQDAGALLTGHFKLRSGKHSNRFFQCALVFVDPARGERLCTELARRVTEQGIQADTVISPAVGGLFVGQEVARALKLKSIFADKVNDELVLKRGVSTSMKPCCSMKRRNSRIMRERLRKISRVRGLTIRST